MKSMFKDPQQAGAFAELGYVIVPLLNSDDITRIESLYRQFDARQYPVLELVEAAPIHKAIVGLLADRLSRYLRHFDPLGGAFVTKDGGKGIYGPHQDCTWVDEAIDHLISVWTPLLDVTVDDGVLGIIPGSHRLPLPDHRISIQFFDPCLTDYFDLLTVKQGDAVLFNGRMIHGSLPNWSGVRRTTMIAAVKHSEAQLITYSRDRENPRIARVYGVDVEFIQSQMANEVRRAAQLGAPVDCSGRTFLRAIEYAEPRYTAEEWKTLLDENGIRVNPEVRLTLAQHGE